LSTEYYNSYKSSGNFLLFQKKSKIGPSLFDDDLFFSDRDEGPVVDLFGGGQSPKVGSFSHRISKF